MSQRICKKCLLRDISENDYFKSLYEYISHLDPEIKALPKEYERRLTLCKSCDQLLNGMCRQCGCFVELRAAIRLQSCPSVEKYW